MATLLKTILSSLIMVAVTLGLFEVFPMATTEPKHDMIIIFVGMVSGFIAYGFMEEKEILIKN